MEVKTLKITSLESVYIMPKIFCMDHYNTSLSNSNHFMSAKICQHKSCIIDFMLAKMEFASAIFKKLYFSKHSIKRCSKICLTIQTGLQWGNDKKIKYYLKEITACKKKPAVSLAKFIIYKFVYVIIHFVIIIVSYLALIRPLFVELGFCQIKRKYILYYYTTIPI